VPAATHKLDQFSAVKHKLALLNFYCVGRFQTFARREVSLPAVLDDLYAFPADLSLLCVQNLCGLLVELCLEDSMLNDRAIIEEQNLQLLCY